MNRTSLTLGLLVPLMLQANLFGQESRVLQTQTGTAVGADFGYAVEGIGDANGDGYDDYVVTSRRDSTNGTVAGAITIYSGDDGTPLRTIHGLAAGDEFGGSVTGCGDLNADGFADVVAGAPLADGAAGADTGALYALSGRDGSLLWSLEGLSAGDELGSAVDAAGDRTGDGANELVVGAPRAVHSVSGNDSGAAYLVSGASGAILTTFEGSDTSGARFGTSVSKAGDVNQDGREDVVIGANQANGATGEVFVISGRNDAAILLAVGGTVSGVGFGAKVVGIGDADGDAVPDFAVGARKANPSAALVEAGRVHVYSGADGTELYRVDGDVADGRLGASLAGVPDADGDGVGDLLLGANPGGAGEGYALLVSGVDGSELIRFEGGAGEALGQAVADLGDQDDDGASTLAVSGLSAGGDLGVAYAFEMRGEANRLHLGPSRRMSLSSGGAIEFEVEYDLSTSAGEPFQIFFALAPGTTSVLNEDLPLAKDAYLIDCLYGTYPTNLSSMYGWLDSNAAASGHFSMAPGEFGAALLGRRIYFAVALRPTLGTLDRVGDAEHFEFVP